MLNLSYVLGIIEYSNCLVVLKTVLPEDILNDRPDKSTLTCHHSFFVKYLIPIAYMIIVTFIVGSCYLFL